ncbi:mitochondrial ribosomal subunit S27-domain-containing protein [Lasiosphaeris hirsuta]|uniref:Small ribosomal subunit protein mS33 n=1 Tax=Lasiosphaeris hirsuta TaxID=260670 RepID=A0AA40DJ55_9PEZI|nr:mitochondrial ribosomal subunit S27-domain-containing protein [Lasiosphaeris hirsuta]
MSVPRARLLALMKARCELFSTTFNPEGLRTGNKILRQRLRGPALAAYYPRKLVTLRDLQKEFAPLELMIDDEIDDDRLEHIAGFVSLPGGPVPPEPDTMQFESPWKECAKEEEGASYEQGEEEISYGVYLLYHSCMEAGLEYSPITRG